MSKSNALKFLWNCFIIDLKHRMHIQSTHSRFRSACHLLVNVITICLSKYVCIQYATRWVCLIWNMWMKLLLMMMMVIQSYIYFVPAITWETTIAKNVCNVFVVFIEITKMCFRRVIHMLNVYETKEISIMYVKKIEVSVFFFLFKRILIFRSKSKVLWDIFTNFLDIPCGSSTCTWKWVIFDQ